MVPANRPVLRVVLTRPANQSDAEAAAFRAAQWDVLHLPLLQIEALQDTSALQAAWRARVLDAEARVQALMFVSANAVDHFLQARPLGSAPVGAQAALGSRAWATGPGTAAALRRWGWPEEHIDWPAAQETFDSEALWQVVRDQVRVGTQVLIVRGGDAQGRSQGRAWLAEQLAAAGAQVHECVAYRTRAALWSAEQREQARQASCDGSVWLVQSSQALQAWTEALPAQDRSQLPLVVTHPRIAQTAHRLGFAHVRVISGAASPDKITA